jgi:hypothetical protein
MKEDEPLLSAGEKIPRWVVKRLRGTFKRNLLIDGLSSTILPQPFPSLSELFV